MCWADELSVYGRQLSGVKWSAVDRLPATACVFIAFRQQTVLVSIGFRANSASERKRSWLTWLDKGVSKRLSGTKRGK